jgi:moderate conductance mechanosensitive channel
VDWLKSGFVWLEAHWVDIALRLGVAVLFFCAALGVGAMLGRWAERALRTRRGRAHSMAGTMRTLVKFAVGTFGAVVALDQLGVNLGAILAGAGIIGLAIGFGAQALVKDVISGFFLIFDGALEEGDQVEIGGKSGLVEDIGLRVTKLRGQKGELWYIQNGEIRTVGNFSRKGGKTSALPLPQQQATSPIGSDEVADAVADAAMSEVANR